MTSKIINIRLDEKTLQDLEQICQWEKNDRTAIIRRLLGQAIETVKMNYTIKLYQEGKISVGKAAELADVDLWTFHDELLRLGISHPSDEEDLKADLAVIRKRSINKLEKIE